MITEKQQDTGAIFYHDIRGRLPSWAWDRSWEDSLMEPKSEFLTQILGELMSSLRETLALEEMRSKARQEALIFGLLRLNTSTANGAVPGRALFYGEG